MGKKYFTDAGTECTPEECKLIESLKSENGGLCGVGRIPHRLRTL